MVRTDSITMTINSTKRLNRLVEYAQTLLQDHFSDWAAKDRVSVNIDKLNKKMLAAYNRCGSGSSEVDNDEDEPSKGREISEDPCVAVQEVTNLITKWSEQFMSDCRSHQRNPQIPKKMDKLKVKMLNILRSQARYTNRT